MNTKPKWADPHAAEAAIREAQARQQRVNAQDKKVNSATWRLWLLGQRNQFQESISAIFKEIK